MCEHDWESSVSFEHVPGNNYDIVTSYLIRQCFYCGTVKAKSFLESRRYTKKGKPVDEPNPGSPSRFGT